MRRKVARGQGGDPSALLSSGKAKCGEHCVQFWASHYKRDRWKYWRKPKEGPLRWWKGWNISHVKKGWESWNYLVWTRLRVYYINVYKYLKGECKEDGDMLFSVVPSDRTRGNGHKLKHRGNSLSIWKHFFCCESDWELAQVAQEGCGITLLRDIQKSSGCRGENWPYLRSGAGPDDLQRSLPTSIILWFCDKRIKSVSLLYLREPGSLQNSVLAYQIDCRLFYSLYYFPSNPSRLHARFILIILA